MKRNQSTNNKQKMQRRQESLERLTPKTKPSALYVATLLICFVITVVIVVLLWLGKIDTYWIFPWAILVFVLLKVLGPKKVAKKGK